jgi:hypothetical protein
MNLSRRWVPVVDGDGNQTVPDDKRCVLVFLCGDRGLLAARPRGASWGHQFGYYDHDRHFWRVCGVQERFVTHWMDLPKPPKATPGGEG